MNTENKFWQTLGVAIALIGGAGIIIGACLRIAVKEVIGAFADLGRDIKLLKKGEG